MTQPPQDQPPYGPRQPYGTGQGPQQPHGQQPGPGRSHPPLQTTSPPAKKSHKGLIGGLVAGFMLGSLAGCIGGVGIGATSNSMTAAPGATTAGPGATKTVTEPATEVTVTEKAKPTATVTVTQKATDQPADEPEPEQTEIGDGTYLVGSEIKPGTWKSSGAEGGLCYADTQSRSGAILEQEVANEGSVVIRITAKAYTFKSSGCGTWKKVG